MLNFKILKSRIIFSSKSINFLKNANHPTKRLLTCQKFMISSQKPKKITFLDQKTAQKVDEELMNDYGFCLENLMELAGQSVAHGAFQIVKKYLKTSILKILVIAGPGNNGGDGIVAARHLKMLGYEPTLIMVKKPEKLFFQNLIKTCECNEIRIHAYTEIEALLKENNCSFSEFVEKNEYALIVDAIFGFSFRPPMRPPYDYIINELKKITTPIFSVDIPSGWDVEKGNVDNAFSPQFLISLTLPKIGMENFEGVHFLGGRFVPRSFFPSYVFSSLFRKMIEKFGWVIPEYKETQQFMEISQTY